VLDVASVVEKIEDYLPLVVGACLEKTRVNIAEVQRVD